MKRKAVVWAAVTGVSLLVVVLAWESIRGYAPSKDGVVEIEIALEDMRRYCTASKIDCSQLNVEQRLAPIPSPLCEETDGKLICDKGKGHWEFVVRVGAGQRYLIAVLPFGDNFVPVGPLSEITLLGS